MHTGTMPMARAAQPARASTPRHGCPRGHRRLPSGHATGERRGVGADPSRAAFAVSQTTGELRLSWDPFIRRQYFLDGATRPAKGVRTYTRARLGPAMISSYASYRPPTSVGMAMEKGPWFFRTFGGGWRFASEDRDGVSGARRHGSTPTRSAPAGWPSWRIRSGTGYWAGRSTGGSPPSPAPAAHREPSPRHWTPRAAESGGAGDLARACAMVE